MATETHADNFQEELLSAIKCLRLELRNNREEFVALSARAEQLLSTLEAKADGDAARGPKLQIDPQNSTETTHQVRPSPGVECALSGAYVETLISGGSTHNFIHPDIVKNFRWEVTPTSPPLRVYVGNVYGESLFCKQKCNNAKFSLQGHEIVVDLFVNPIHGPNMVLGAPWLKSLGEIYRNYGYRTMEFTHNDKLVTLRGVWENGRHIFYNTKKG